MGVKVLELFAGSKSFSNVANSLGLRTFSSDIEPFEQIDYVTDVLDFDYDVVPFVPDVIWASPPCTGFSVASIGKHWNNDHTPKTDTARIGIRLVKKTIAIIEHYKILNPNLVWFIENPRGKLRKLNLVGGVRHTVTYCQYGDERMKPTDIWTNSTTWQPRPICKNGSSCHISAPRGSKTGTQGRVGAYDRSKMPPELCKEILTTGRNI